MGNLKNNKINVPKISIIVPVYNAADVVGRCLESLIGQTLQDIEIICVDDKSTDDSVAVLNQYSVKDSRIRVLCNETNRGTLVTRKKGVSQAAGEYIMFADNDDYYDKNACKELYELIEEKKTDILMYEVLQLADNGIYEDGYKHLRIKQEHIDGENCLKTENRVMWLWNKIVRSDVCKKAYEAASDERMVFAEDAYGCWLLHYFSKSMSTVNKSYYYYDYQRGSTGKKTISYREFESRCNELKLLEKLLEELFINNGTIERDRWIIEFETVRGLNSMINYWSNRLSEDDEYMGFNYLCEIYGQELVQCEIRKKCIHEESEKLRYREKNTNLRVKNRKLSESSAMKIGRLITYLPQKIMKMGR